MSEQQFDEVGQVQITNYGNIVNEGEREEIIERRREARRQELVQRQLDHIADRDAADRRWRHSPFRWVTMLGLLAVAGTGFYEFLHVSAAHWLWPIQMMMLAIAGATSMVFEHIRRDCRALSRYHNKAIEDINGALHVL